MSIQQRRCFTMTCCYENRYPSHRDRSSCIVLHIPMSVKTEGKYFILQGGRLATVKTI